MASPTRRRKPTRAVALRTRPPIDRMRVIFLHIKSGTYPNRQQLAADIEVTTKTIQRDLDFMRDRLELPIVYDAHRLGYCFTEPVDHFPMVELTEAELVSIFVAQKALGQYKGTSFEQPLRYAFEKLAGSLQGKVTLAWNDLDEEISFRSFDMAPADLELFQAVSEAVRSSRELSFQYKKVNARGYERRRLRPYHLACVLDQWYVVGHDLKRNALRTFALTRMREADGTGPLFDRPADFSIRKHLEKSFGVFTGTGQHRIRLRFVPFAAQFIRERVWHPSQKLQELADGGVELTLELSSLVEVEQWILSWGEHVRVLAPKPLARNIRKRHLAAAHPEEAGPRGS